MHDALIKRSIDAVQRAIKHYLTDEHDQFLIQAAIAFELLGKARLASIHPSLIVDRDFDSFLHVCAAGKHAKRPPWNIRTITATDVLSRCTQLHPGLNDFGPRLKLLAEFRNSVVHFGEVVDEEKKEIFHTLLASTSLITDEMGISREYFFGEFAPFVATHLDSSLAEVNQVIAERIAIAKAEYVTTYGMLDGAHLTSIVKMVQASYKMGKYDDVWLECPACGNDAVLSGVTDVDWQVDYDDEGNPESGLSTDAYLCTSSRDSLWVTSPTKTVRLRTA